jgi:hypothetical protein
MGRLLCRGGQLTAEAGVTPAAPRKTASVFTQTGAG